MGLRLKLSLMSIDLFKNIQHLTDFVILWVFGGQGSPMKNKENVCQVVSGCAKQGEVARNAQCQPMFSCCAFERPLDAL